jgi:hypothetical protein
MLVTYFHGIAVFGEPEMVAGVLTVTNESMKKTRWIIERLDLEVGNQSIVFTLLSSCLFSFLRLVPPSFVSQKNFFEIFFGRWKARRSWTGSNVPTTSRIHVGSVHSLRTAEINNSYQ